MYGATNFRIISNTFRNYHYCPNESAQFAKAIFVAAGNNGGLIEGNQFVDNGTTGHLFFSWLGRRRQQQRDLSPQHLCPQQTISSGR